MKANVMSLKKTEPWKIYLAWIGFTEAVGGLSGWLIRDGVKLYNATITQPPFSPPSLVFPIVWGILYALMGIGAARVFMAHDSMARLRALIVFLVQLGFNFFWSIIFFNLQAFGPAFFWLITLWIMIIAMIALFRKVDKPAGRLQVPYLLWVTFAAYLNYGVWRLN